MRLMVDIHCHILYGLDDGAESLEVAMEMAEMAIADGITHVVATPHANADYSFHPELVQQRRNEIQARLGDRLTLATGCDFHLSFENRSEEHTSELQSQSNLVCRLLLEKKKQSYHLPRHRSKNSSDRRALDQRRPLARTPT